MTVNYLPKNLTVMNRIILKKYHRKLFWKLLSLTVWIFKLRFKIIKILSTHFNNNKYPANIDYASKLI